ncbi:DUF6234 family protein [Streptomyces sp. RGM 3693]|uniref:DUF6234 family protein n=1 Tax=Streptomyces sp. RGM 3693 TaxID=3413284 RepID=UPI003D2C9E0B
MLRWVLDVLLGVALTAVEVAALVAFWFAENLKLWAAQGKHPPGSAVRLWLVLTAGPAGLALVSLQAFRAGLPATGLTQALIAAPLAVIMTLGLGTESSRWVARTFERHLGKRRHPHARHGTHGRDTGRHDTGRCNSGRHDVGRRNSGRHDTGTDDSDGGGPAGG